MLFAAPAFFVISSLLCPATAVPLRYSSCAVHRLHFLYAHLRVAPGCVLSRFLQPDAQNIRTAKRRASPCVVRPRLNITLLLRSAEASLAIKEMFLQAGLLHRSQRTYAKSSVLLCSHRCLRSQGFARAGLQRKIAAVCQRPLKAV
jgi:hypothetical protein